MALDSLTSGTNDLALGALAGSAVTSGNNNIEIGAVGSGTDSGVLRIGTQGAQTSTLIAGISGATAASGVAVYVNSNGKLGTLTSSIRYKTGVHDMAAESDALYSLRPVAFRYKAEYDPAGLQQYGLVAEEVQKTCPALVAYDANGKPYSVRYEAVNAMLLNEFLKEHRRAEAEHQQVAAQAQAISKLEDTVKAQGALLEKLAAQLQVSTAIKAAPPIAASGR
jgi:uncharacterized coiled-coil protein SlyX